MSYFESDAEIDWRMQTGLADNPYYYGSGILNQLDMGAPAGDEFASFSSSLSGSGAIVTTDPH